MAGLRKPFQGVWNIIRFNWQFYVMAPAALVLLLVAASFAGNPYQLYVYILCVLITISVTASLLASFYVYDLSNLYSLNWLDELNGNDIKTMVNINAGFDETSILLKDKFPAASFTVLDFYNPVLHTEVSIKRARKAYPPYPGTLQVNTKSLPLKDNSVDAIFAIFAAHEIRNNTERATFFTELNRALKPNGKIIVTEHLRDVPNFLVYNIGFFHFHTKRAWHNTFTSARLTIIKEIKLNPFVSTFILIKNGNPS